jgi:beta-lactamase superfamily II metal-dependent hydrolase
MPRRAVEDAATSRIHLLDVGEKQYGDAVFCQLGGKTILLDGGHKGDDVGDGDHTSIPDQLRRLTATDAGPVVVDLVVVSHLHDDHIGCLPEMIDSRAVVARNALVLDPSWRWDAIPDAAPTDAVAVGARQVALAIAEEPRAALSDAQLLEFLADAASLQDRYVAMLGELERQGNLYRYGVDNIDPLEQSFAGVGFRVLGPSKKQLQITQQKVRSDATDAFRASVDALRTDAATSVADLYRELLRANVGGEDASDGRGGPGSSLNLQSLVTLLRFDNRRALLTGDMQLADPESSDPELRGELDELVERIAKDAPYDFVKLAHHGSWNGFDETIADAVGDTRAFGICAGAKSKAHPDASVLDLLAKRRPAPLWARTDRNRLSTFSFGQRVTVRVETGRKSDHRANREDATEPPPVIARTPGTAAVVTETRPGSGAVEIVTRVLRTPARVRLTIEVDAEGEAFLHGGDPVSERRTVAANSAAVNLARGRKLPTPLLVVTSSAGLARNIGASEAARVLTAFRGAGHVVLDTLPAGMTDASQAIAVVTAEIRRRDSLEGVLILGGYDVVPAQRQDCLTPQLRDAVERAIAAGARRDLDDNIVWSDDVYAGADPNDPLPRLPISRIPDARSADLVVHAVNATRTVAPLRSGIRNHARPFADAVFAALPGQAAIGVSAPLTSRTQPPFPFAPWAYFMLHGSDADATRFWGEQVGSTARVLAFDVNLIKPPVPEVAFAGCCWGALPVREKANELPRGRAPTPRGPRDAICLAYLDYGALGFVGCTGSHFSPVEPPYAYAGGPMHVEFWRARQQGHGPARALFEAKRRYRQDLPHGQTLVMPRAVEYKTLYQFTCLGLGW